MNYTITATVTALMLTVFAAGCRTPAPAGSTQAALAESDLLAAQSQMIQGNLPAPGQPAGLTNPPTQTTMGGILPGETIIINAWHQDTATVLSGYPMEIQAPATGPSFLPHFGLVDLIGQTPKALETTLLERFNAGLATPPHGASAPQAPPGRPNLLRPGDALSISVWLRDNISMPPGFPFDTRISPDATVFVPHMGVIQTADCTLNEFQERLQMQFGKILNGCSVVVMHAEQKTAPASRGQPLAHVSVTRKASALAMGRDRAAVEIGHHFIVLGRVSSPGLYPLKPGLRVRDAIAMAGGLERYAHRNIFLVRGTAAQPEVIRIDMNDIMLGRALDKNIQLAMNDAIYVAPKALWSVADFIGLLLMPVLQLRDAIYVYDRFAE